MKERGGGQGGGSGPPYPPPGGGYGGPPPPGYGGAPPPQSAYGAPAAPPAYRPPHDGPYGGGGPYTSASVSAYGPPPPYGGGAYAGPGPAGLAGPPGPPGPPGQALALALAPPPTSSLDPLPRLGQRIGRYTVQLDTATNLIFYWDPLSRQSQWDPPRWPAPPPSLADLPRIAPQWVEVLDEATGRHYYWNEDTDMVTWHVPG